ncbi:MAG: tetratricopeptide repeat protein, partial [Rhizomicrobium sp.]
MQRMLVRVAALALCTSALTACSMMGGGEDKAMLSRSANNSPLAIATDLTSAIHQAQLLRTKGDLDGATRVISQLMLAAPDDARVVGEYGKLLVQQGRSDDAAQFLRRAVELEPSEWTYYSALGVAYDQLRDPGNARNAYEHALALKPGEPAILNNYAMSRMLAGDTTNARALMIQAKASGSPDPKIAANLAILDST